MEVSSLKTNANGYMRPSHNGPSNIKLVLVFHFTRTESASACLRNAKSINPMNRYNAGSSRAQPISGTFRASTCWSA